MVQDATTKEVLMTAYMNEETLKRTIESGRAVFWSRSREEVWVKGATSGNYLYVREIRVDCDEDCLLILAEPAGAACHTGHRTCFFRKLENGELTEVGEGGSSEDILARLMAISQDRKRNPQAGSYTNYLFDKGADKILKKVGEEAAEVIIAGKNKDRDEISYEVADLMYHLTVMLADNDMTWIDIFDELEKRR